MKWDKHSVGYIYKAHISVWTVQLSKKKHTNKMLYLRFVLWFDFGLVINFCTSWILCSSMSNFCATEELSRNKKIITIQIHMNAREHQKTHIAANEKEKVATIDKNQHLVVKSTYLCFFFYSFIAVVGIQSLWALSYWTPAFRHTR